MNPENFRPRMDGGSQQYLDSAIRGASPAKLRLLLLQRAVEVAGTLARVWRNGELRGTNEHSLTLLEIMGELLSGVSGSSDAGEKDLCNRVADLYVFLTKHLVIAEEHSDAGAIDEIRMVLEVETETWRSVCAQELGPKRPAEITQAVSAGINFSV